MAKALPENNLTMFHVVFLFIKKGNRRCLLGGAVKVIKSSRVRLSFAFGDDLWYFYKAGNLHEIPQNCYQ